MDYKDKIRKLLALAKSPEPEAAKTVPNEPQQAAPVVSTADKKAPPPRSR